MFSGKNKCQRNLRARCAARRLSVLLAREHFPDFPDPVLNFCAREEMVFTCDHLGISSGNLCNTCQRTFWIIPASVLIFFARGYFHRRRCDHFFNNTLTLYIWNTFIPVLSLFSKLNKMKLHILKITDRDDEKSDPMYNTIKGLRERVLKDWFDLWETMPTEEMREKLKTDDEYMIDWLSGWGYDVEIILTITENDLN
jgi:hypothetical protein